MKKILILLNIHFNIIKLFIFYLKYKYVILQKEVINMDTVPMWMKNLDDEDMIFIKRFILASGSLKEVAKLYGVTYPTVRVRLNKLIDKIKLAEDKTDNDEFVELIKRYVIDEDIDNMKWRGGNKKVTLLNCSIVDLPLYFE